MKQLGDRARKMIDGYWPLILGVCTLLGGAAAVGYFWEKIIGWMSPPPIADTASGRGGAAVRGGDGSNIDIQNMDGAEMRGGMGGAGGSGGDAIVVSSGAGVTIINRGKILGGDAGQ